MTLIPHKFAGLAGFALLLASAAHAQSEDAPAKSLPLWELGAFAFGVSQQAYPGSDEQLTRGLLLPYGQYRGRFFRADRETAGLRAVKTPVYELDVGVSASFGGSSSEIGARRGMPALGTLAEFGPRLKINLGSGSTGSDEQLTRGLLLPYGQYRGRFFRADRETAGLRAVKTPVYELDVGVSASFGGSSSEIGARRGMPDLGTLAEFGPRLKINLGSGSTGADADRSAGRWRLELPLRGVFDLSDGATHRGMVFEPEINFQSRSLGGYGVAVSLGAIVGDRRLNRTFYGVAPIYALPDRPAYEAKNGLVAWRLSASVSRTLTPDWRAVGFARFDSVAGAANEASPLVRRITGATVGVGLSYTWLRSEARASE